MPDTTQSLSSVDRLGLIHSNLLCVRNIIPAHTRERELHNLPVAQRGTNFRWTVARRVAQESFLS